MANFAALAAARSAKAPGNVVRDGLAATGRRLCLYVSQEGHFSVRQGRRDAGHRGSECARNEDQPPSPTRPGRSRTGRPARTSPRAIFRSAWWPTPAPRPRAPSTPSASWAISRGATISGCTWMPRTGASPLWRPPPAPCFRGSPRPIPSRSTRTNGSIFRWGAARFYIRMRSGRARPSATTPSTPAASAWNATKPLRFGTTGPSCRGPSALSTSGCCSSTPARNAWGKR